MNITLSKRERDALGAEYRGYKRRERLPGEALPPTMPFAPWEPQHRDIVHQYVRPGADAAMAIKSRGV